MQVVKLFWVIKMTEERVSGEGFLNDEIQIVVDNKKEENKDIYQLIYKYNSLCYKLEKTFEKDNSNNVELYLFTTFSEIHTSFQSYIILLERGLYEDAQIILRSIYDKIFNILYVFDDFKNFELLFQKQVYLNIKLCEYIEENKLYDYMTKEKIVKNKEKYIKLRKLNEKGKQIQPLDNKKICEKLNLEELYVHYKLLSDYTHNGFSVVESRIIQKEDGIIIDQNFKFGKLLDEVAKVIGILDYVIRKICEYLKLEDLCKKFEEIENELEKLEDNN